MNTTASFQPDRAQILQLHPVEAGCCRLMPSDYERDAADFLTEFQHYFAVGDGSRRRKTGTGHDEGTF